MHYNSIICTRLKSYNVHKKSYSTYVTCAHIYIYAQEDEGTADSRKQLTLQIEGLHRVILEINKLGPFETVSRR